MFVPEMELDGKKPRWYRQSKGNAVSWEIYGWRSFFLTISVGTVEIQINNWGSVNQRSRDVFDTQRKVSP